MATFTSLTNPARTSLVPQKLEAVPVAAAAAGGAAGYYSWPRHRWLGAVAGVAVGNAASTLLSSPIKRDALTPLGAAAGGYAGTKVWRKRPVLGFVLGLLAGGLAGEFVAKKV